MDIEQIDLAIAPLPLSFAFAVAPRSHVKETLAQYIPTWFIIELETF